MTANDASSADRTMVIERTVNAPPELVWQAWTEAERVAQWWGPNGFRTTTHEMNLRVGGVWRFIMHGPDGTDYPNRIIYREIVKPERLVYDHDDDGASDAHTFRTTVTFAAQGGKTKVTMRAVFATKEAYDVVKPYAIDGGNQTLGRLDQYVTTGTVTS